ncbi:bifunctional helix-turn-helix transcriptional regulator/GNAT family N-acetyltransferase [Piscinibacter defluvii]|uniref:bifunctional helix-turn-helix transcriptional regulator/GNAT family N-acetyltransferase n=1 Tax=Piscinibacter defluvii TaxID=1796922 RepID=UPI000FDF5A72|nr:bifunctional helix-turn-helix transcriptional regulator/GNAT family N-acetyltransferase [Piscinibacter defluvii]
MAAAPDPARIEAVRRFNRFYTRRIGVLDDGLLDSPFSLAEARLLWELAHADARLTASRLARELDLDPGYLSRLLRRLKDQGLVRTSRSKEDARVLWLSLSPAGQRAFAPLDARSREQVGTLLGTLDEPRQQALLDAMTLIEDALSDTPRPPAPIALRALQPGDLGWVIGRHGALYAQEYGWSEAFEALVARIAADFVDRFDPAHEAAWIAERDGRRLGCVFLVQARDEARQQVIPAAAQLRMLLVEPAARGQGLGRRLVDECERFARAQRYRRILLWTNRNLDAARAIYEKAGYRLIASEPHHSFGHDLVGETWEKLLA